MNPIQSTLRRPSLTAGVSLIAMAVLAPAATLGALGPALIGDYTLVPLAVVALTLVAVLDVVIASALYDVFAPTSISTARLAAWLRLTYTAALVVAIGLLTGKDAAAVTGFYDVWNLALALFGAHLLVIGWLAVKTSYVPTFVGALVAVAGVGYLVDSIAGVLIADYSFSLATFTFVGEIALILWLLIAGRTTAVPA